MSVLPWLMLSVSDIKFAIKMLRSNGHEAHFLF